MDLVLGTSVYHTMLIRKFYCGEARFDRTKTESSRWHLVIFHTFLQNFEILKSDISCHMHRIGLELGLTPFLDVTNTLVSSQ
jgi:hypothetical protein